MKKIISVVIIKGIHRKYKKQIKSFIDAAADCFDNRRDAKIVPSAILLLANCRLVTNFLYLCP